MHFWWKLVITAAVSFPLTTIRGSSPVHQWGTYRSRSSCDASYNLPCSRANSQWLVLKVQKQLLSFFADAGGAFQIGSFYDDVNNGVFNLEVGFYPFIYQRNRDADAAKELVCVAHGGLDLSHAQPKVGDNSSGNSMANELISVAKSGGGWAKYNEGPVKKIAYVSNLTLGDLIIGVQYTNEDYPLDKACLANAYSSCVIDNARSIVGTIRSTFEYVTTIRGFTLAFFQVHVAKEYDLRNLGFHVYIHSYKEQTYDLNTSVLSMVEALGYHDDAAQLHRDYVLAADGAHDGWLRYHWNRPYDPNGGFDVRIGKLEKVAFEREQFYVGVSITHSDPHISNGPNGTLCSATYGLPCAFSAAMNIASLAFSFMVSSYENVITTFRGVSHGTKNTKFMSQDFFVYVFDFNGTCVASSQHQDVLIGASMSHLVQHQNFSNNGETVHQILRVAAQNGGGWVAHEGIFPNNGRRALSYIFYINLYGRDYYGGVSLRQPKKIFSMPKMNSEARRKDNMKVDCTRRYRANCNEDNIHLIVGRALTDLAVATQPIPAGAASLSNSERRGRAVQKVFDDITGQSNRYTINDFFMTVFSFDECSKDLTPEGALGSGCVFAHGEDARFVNNSWKTVLDHEGITSIDSVSLHNGLAQLANKGGGWHEVPWFGIDSKVQTKLVWVSKFQIGVESFYIISDFFDLPVPPTCNDCPTGKGCRHKDQEYCEDTEPRAFYNIAWTISIGLLIIFSLILLRVWSRHQNKLAAKYQGAERLGVYMDSVVKVTSAMPSLQTLLARERGQVRHQDDQADISGQWYWEVLEEDGPGPVDGVEERNGKRFVTYCCENSLQIEQAYLMWRDHNGARDFTIAMHRELSFPNHNQPNQETTPRRPELPCYKIDFSTMKESDESNQVDRIVERIEVELSPWVPSLDKIPPLPGGVNFDDYETGEALLEAKEGQLIQISKRHESGGWCFGSVLYDPLVRNARNFYLQSLDLELQPILAGGLHDRQMSGWFPVSITQRAEVRDMMTLFEEVGGKDPDTLKPPSEWSMAHDKTSYLHGAIEVNSMSDEYLVISKLFPPIVNLRGKQNRVIKVERIQNLPLWQSFAVKKATIELRHEERLNKGDSHVNNTGPTELKLFHGTPADAAEKILEQGFNRTFCGKNGVRLGRGVYFSSELAFASTFSPEDNKGVKRMFISRVACGDWCLGNYDVKTPNAIPGRGLELYDSTVDTLINPKIFVSFHDAQCYPEYLIHFKEVTKEQ